MPVDNIIQPFNKELDFEKALCEALTHHGWEPTVIVNPTEEDLIKNWKAIIFNNNRDINRLGEYPLTDSEMQQIILQVNAAKTPYKINQLINFGEVSITRDNADDVINCGKVVYLKIFDAREINSGQSVYQIVRQPKFATKHPLASDRRGDVMLLINGMPVIHIELKRSGVDVSQAVNQIKKYAHEGVFAQGIYSLVQIFVAMTPNKTLYFANPGEAENFASAFQFHWSDANNDEIHDWKRICANLLSIPLAHQMVGYYTIADDKDSTLKVLRSYQYDAVNAICDRVHHTNWDDHGHRGGFVWHTTGSGKTMTSFKSAQLIAKAGDADKVVFLLDRIELSTQSVDEYRGFANADDNVLDTENTVKLISHLESSDKNDCLIVTSLQKMSRVTHSAGVAQSKIDAIGHKRMVFVVDECHRGMYGEMLTTIKKTFPRALLFGFTGTPIFEENAKGDITTGVIFGDMLSKYTIADGIPDGNVLGFDPYKVTTYDAHEMRRAVALRKADVEDEEALDADYSKRAIYETYMDEEATPMLKIEDEAKSYFTSEEHHCAVMHKIAEERPTLSRNGKFHAILATKNIPEAIAYYRLFKQYYPSYNVVAIFDDSIDNNGKSEPKEDAILEMLEDYNRKFDQNFAIPSYDKYKKDVAKRLAHKGIYKYVAKDKQVDLLIVVTQMLTGYDSKWINTLYVDKLMQYVDVIQAFSRTNRLFGPEKPFGIIKYFCRPLRMEQNIQEALDLYVDQPMLVFVDKLEANLEKVNKHFEVISNLFHAEGIQYFESLPVSEISRNKFAKEFCAMTRVLEAAKMQGFYWEKLDYEFKHTNGWVMLHVDLDEETYKVLRQRYKELFPPGPEPVPVDTYELDPYITETGTGTIDADYINQNFHRYVKYLYTRGEDDLMVQSMLKALHKTFATFTQADQRIALTILHDIRRGDLVLAPNKTIFDYINDYRKRLTDAQVFAYADATGLNLSMLKEITSRDVTDANIDERGRFQELMTTLDREKAVLFLKRVTNKEVKKMFLASSMSDITRTFLLYPEERKRIIFALQNDDAFYAKHCTVEPSQEDDVAVEDEPQEVVTTVSAKLSDEQKRENVASLVRKNIRGIAGMPLTNQVVNGFFKVMNMRSIDALDGVAFDMYDAFDELFAHEQVTFVKKHVCVGNLLMKYETILKKLYYLLYDMEAAPTGSEKEVTLRQIIKRFDYLKTLSTISSGKLHSMNERLKRVVEWRNQGAHFGMYMPEEELDIAIETIVTLYMYSVGMSLKDLKYKYPEELADINTDTLG